MTKRKKIGLALGSGGPRGFAHIGVIKVLLENNIPIDYIAGTSAGSIVGGMYALSKDIESVENFWNTLDYINLLKAYASPTFGSGIIKSDKLEKFLKLYVKDAKVQDTKIPLNIITADMSSGDRYVFKKGPLSSAMVASSTIPIFIKPYVYGGHKFIDGGVAEPVPVETVKEMGADIVIAVNLDAVFFDDNAEFKFLHLANVSKDAFLMLRYNLARVCCESADVTIAPCVKYGFFKGFTKVKEGIEVGEQEARKMLPEILKIVNG